MTDLGWHRVGRLLWRVVLVCLLGGTGVVALAASRQMAPPPPANPCIAPPGQKGKLKLRADATTYDVREKTVKVTKPRVRVQDACGKELMFLTAPAGDYDQTAGRLNLSGPVGVKAQDLSLAATGAVFFTETSLLELAGPLTARAKGRDAQETVVVKAKKARVNTQNGDIAVTGPVQLKGKDYTAAADTLEGNYKTGRYTVCCKVRGRFQEMAFSGKTFDVDSRGQSLATDGTYRVVVDVKEKQQPAAAPPPPKPAGGVGKLWPSLSFDLKKAVFEGTGFAYDGKSGWFRASSAVKADFGKDNGAGRLGSLRADVKKQVFYLGDGLNLKLGEVTLAADAGVYEGEKKLLTLSRNVRVSDATPGQERDMRAKNASVHFRPGGALITLSGKVGLEMTVDTDTLSGSLKL